MTKLQPFNLSISVQLPNMLCCLLTSYFICNTCTVLQLPEPHDTEGNIFFYEGEFHKVLTGIS